MKKYASEKDFKKFIRAINLEDLELIYFALQAYLKHLPMDFEDLGVVWPRREETVTRVLELRRMIREVIAERGRGE